jgi:hypothetical protein
MDGGLPVKVRWALGLGLAALMGIGGYAALRHRTTLPRDGKPVASASASAAPSAKPHLGRREPAGAPRWPFEDPADQPPLLPFRRAAVEQEARIRALPPELRRT